MIGVDIKSRIGGEMPRQFVLHKSLMMVKNMILIGLLVLA